MKRSLRNSLIALSLLASTNSVHAGDVILRLEADSKAPPFARLHSADPAITHAAPVLDAAKAEDGWRWTEYKSDFKGYVATENISKSLEVESGARILANPKRDAMLLTQAEHGDEFQVIASDDNWATVLFNKEVPVYFNQQSLPAAKSTAAPISTAVPVPPLAPEPPASLAPTPPAPEPTSRATATQRRISVNPNAPLGRRSPQELPPENVVWSGTNKERAVASVLAPASDPNVSNETGSRLSARLKIQDKRKHHVESMAEPTHRPIEVADSPDTSDQDAPIYSNPDPVVVPSAETAPPETPRTPQVSAGTPTRALVGQLVREISNSGPRYPLRLHVSGRRVAYVDMSQIFISDLRPYLNQNVYIRGEVMPVVPGSRELIIIARVIRIAD